MTAASSEERQFLRIMRILLPFLVLNGLVFCYFVLAGSDNECVIFKRYGIYCLGCGGTRCVLALLKGNFWVAFRYNPFLFIALPFLVGAAGCLTFYVYRGSLPFGIRVRGFDTLNVWMWLLVLALSLIAVLTLLRNLIPELQPLVQTKF